MTSEDIRSELSKVPFVPLRLHLVSGKTLDIPLQNAAWLLQNSLLVFRNVHAGAQQADGYDVLALRNIERIEQLPSAPRRRRAS